MSTQMERRLQGRMDRREAVQSKMEELLAERDGGALTDVDERQLLKYREEITEADNEIETLGADLEAHNAAVERSAALRRSMLGAIDGTEANEDGIVYRTMAAYARDMILTRNDKTGASIAQQFGRDEIEAAASRLQLLQRTPANTLSSNVGGLQPPQHIDQIFQVVNTTRPIVASARRDVLVRGTLTYPAVTQKPVVAVQAAEKTEAGNTGLVIGMVSTTASTYLGGGDLSWQAVNWSTPNALDQWFEWCAASYALETEKDAAQALQHSAFSYNISSTLAASSTFVQWMTAIGAGYSEVFANSGRIANTLYLAPDLYGYLLGLTSSAFTQFMNVNGNQIGPFNIVVSRGMDAGVAAVGDSSGLLVAETAGAPVELRVVEPAIGGYEVGLIGAFEAVVVDPGAFAMITTAS